jgi:uncharacterized protein (TIGR02757 family)
MPTPRIQPHALHRSLDALYAEVNRRCYVAPDPLQLLYAYDDPADREVAGLVAATLAFGNVKQIVRNAGGVLERMPRPRRYLAQATPRTMTRTFAGFRHRYVAEPQLVALLIGMKAVIERHGSLEACFAGAWRETGDTCEALARFADALRGAGSIGENYLLPDPRRGSACKRLHLYLRWMVRRDAVDPGGWDGVPPGALLVPVDTHMHRIATALGLTRRHQADLRAAREITVAFRRFAPEDPVRYDFALTRLGIRRERTLDDFVAGCRGPAGSGKNAA